MLKETITFTDFNDQQQTKDFYFNLSKSELAKVELGLEGGIEGYLTKIIADGNGRKIINFFEDIIKDSYGIRSADGSAFEKDEAAFVRFEGSGAYDELIMKVLNNPEYAGEFIKGIIPAKLREEAEQKIADGFRPGAQTLPQSEIDKRAKLAEDARLEEQAANQAAAVASADAFTAAQPVQIPQDLVPQSPVLEPTEVLRGIREREAEQAGANEVSYTNSAPQLNIEEPLAPGDPGYAQGLTRRQAKELGLLG